MRALVVYGSKMGGTEGLADMVCRSLEKRACTTDIFPAAEARTTKGYDVVVVGGALYAGRWHRDAARFVKRFRRSLRSNEVWFFSSGPLGDTAAAQDEIPPVRQVRKLMDLVGARVHTTFGGRLAEDPPGFMARAMAKTAAGDWRDEAAVDRWVDQNFDAVYQTPRRLQWL